MAVQRPGDNKPFAPGSYSHGGYSLVLAGDGGIRVRSGDSISGYSACLYRDLLKGWEEYGKPAGGSVRPLDNPNLITVGDTIYHIPTWKAKSSPSPPPTQPPPARDTRLFTLTFRHAGIKPTRNGLGMYESVISLAGPASGVFRGSIYPDKLTEFARIQDGQHELRLTLHKKNGTATPADLVVKNNGDDRRPALTVNNCGTVPMIKPDGTRSTAIGINVHNGFNDYRGSTGCLTIQKADWPRFIEIFLDLYPDFSDWYEGNGSWRGRKIGTLIVQT